MADWEETKSRAAGAITMPKYIDASVAADMLGVQRDTILRWARAGKISRYREEGSRKWMIDQNTLPERVDRTCNTEFKPPDYVTKEWLEEQLRVKNRTQESLAVELGCTSHTIAYLLRRLGVRGRTRKEVAELRVSHPCDIINCTRGGWIDQSDREVAHQRMLTWVDSLDEYPSLENIAEHVEYPFSMCDLESMIQTRKWRGKKVLEPMFEMVS